MNNMTDQEKIKAMVVTGLAEDTDDAIEQLIDMGEIGERENDEIEEWENW